MSSRRVQRIKDLVITTDENILISDSGCDQTIINLNAFLIQTYTGEYFNIGGALQGMKSSDLELVNDAYTLATLPDGEKIVLKINQALCDNDPFQTEALFNHISCALTVFELMIAPPVMLVPMVNLVDSV
jgi:hypothetical protein